MLNHPVSWRLTERSLLPVAHAIIVMLGTLYICCLLHMLHTCPSILIHCRHQCVRCCHSLLMDNVVLRH